MDLEEVQEITETNIADQANEYLRLGWVLLAVAEGHSEDGEPYLQYSLGWRQGSTPMHPDFTRGAL